MRQSARLHKDVDKARGHHDNSKAVHETQQDEEPCTRE